MRKILGRETAGKRKYLPLRGNSLDTNQTVPYQNVTSPKGKYKIVNWSFFSETNNVKSAIGIFPHKIGNDAALLVISPRATEMINDVLTPSRPLLKKSKVRRDDFPVYGIYEWWAAQGQEDGQNHGVDFQPQMQPSRCR
jgi:hypothetical protein